MPHDPSPQDAATREDDKVRAAIEAELQQLTLQFTAQVPQRVVELHALWVAWQRGGLQEAASQMERAAHSLAGSGATFGYPAITAVAQALEHHLVQHRAQASPEHRAQIERLLAALEQSVDRIQLPEDPAAGTESTP